MGLRSSTVLTSGELRDFGERGILWQETMVWAREGLKDGFEHCQESVYVRMLAKAYHRKIPILESVINL